MSGLDISSRDSLVKGGGRGPAISPRQPETSVLFQAVTRKGPLAMPPTAPLAAAEIELLRRWIEAGAPWITETSSPPAGELKPRWWSFIRPSRPPVPASANPWPRNAIDEFILEKLRAHHLTSAPQADRAVLARRLSFDLTGLPPAADEVDAFVKDPAPDAYERLVDRLLESPRYGEK
jgi:hypothetical protein